jgi:hypothetical protein
MAKTRLFMIACSLWLAVQGLAATFAPREVLAWLHAPAEEPAPVLVQLLGALSFSMAVVNWTARGFVIGGIYARPLTLGNFLHFMVGGLALLKQQAAQSFDGLLLAMLIGYAFFALGFGTLVFGHGTACATTPREQAP